MPKKAGVWNKLVDYLGFGPEEDDFEDEQEEAAPADPWPADVRRSTDRRSAPVIPITTPTQKQGTFKVMVVEPRSFEEVQTIVDQMRSRRPVILNLESLDKDLAQKILNFLNGAIYALNGETQRVAQGIFFFAPQGVDVSTMGRGLTGTAIGGGAVDLPPSILEKLTGISSTEETAPVRPLVPSSENDILGRAANRAGLDRNPGHIDWKKR